MGNNDEDRVPIIEARLLRTDDLIDLRLEATGCTLEPIDGGSELVCGPDSALVLHFPPQHIGEQVWQTMPAPPAPPPTPSQHVAAGPTRIVYQLAEGTRIPFTLDGVLAALPDLPLRVSKLATAAGEALDGAGPEPPADDETAIEAPYHLVVSPGPQGAFSHAVAPVGPPGRAELWRTRLTVRRDDGTLDDADAGRRIVRALWNRDQDQAPADFIPGSDDDQPLKPFDRYAIVAQTHGGIPENADTPLLVANLALSSLGAWFDWRQTWEFGQSIADYRHQAFMGRDGYVRVVYRLFSSSASITRMPLGPRR
nr:hypothetical protein [Tessaracoccus bendigoensis]